MNLFKWACFSRSIHQKPSVVWSKAHRAELLSTLLLCQFHLTGVWPLSHSNPQPPRSNYIFLCCLPTWREGGGFFQSEGRGFFVFLLVSLSKVRLGLPTPRLWVRWRLAEPWKDVTGVAQAPPATCCGVSVPCLSELKVSVGVSLIYCRNRTS